MEVIKQLSKVDTWEGGNTKKYLIIHDTDSSPKTTWQNILAFFKRKDEISVHYTVSYDGEIVQLADENDRCFHCGKSMWGQDYALNNSSIGIEVFYNGSAFTDKQREATVWLIKDIMARNAIPAYRVLRHADIALPPGRRSDVRPSFYEKWGTWDKFQAYLQIK